MNSLKTLSFTTLAALAAVSPANAFFYGGFRVDKTYRQTTTNAPAFAGGEVELFVSDGSLTITGCANNYDGAPFDIDTMAGCNIGSNAVVAVFGDETPAFNPYYLEVVGLEEATTIEPGRPDLVKINARPTVDFPLTNTPPNFIQRSVFYDTRSVSGDVREYRLAAGTGLGVPGYSWEKEYTSRKQMEKEIVEGVYQYKFPKRTTPGYPVQTLYLNFPVKNTVEGYVTSPIKQGFRFTNISSFVNGFAQVDANSPMIFKWEGLTSNYVSSADKLYFSVRNFETAVPATANDPAGGYFFPPNIQARLLSPVQSEYTIPPFGALLGTKKLIEVELVRDPGQNIGIVNYRRFQLAVEFVNSFPGSMAASFPEGTSTGTMAKDADPDGDGISNWVEWLSGTDPSKSNAPTTLSGMSFVPPSAAKDDSSTGYWEMTLNRPSYLQAGASIVIESSTDLASWSQLSNNAEWEIIDNPEEPQIRVRSKSSTVGEKRYFRARYTYTGN